MQVSSSPELQNDQTNCISNVFELQIPLIYTYLPSW